jgi:hypothetical protein
LQQGESDLLPHPYIANVVIGIAVGSGLKAERRGRTLKAAMLFLGFRFDNR